jgi:hypothetical protein
MALTLQQKRDKADAFFDKLFVNLQKYFQDDGFHTIPITKINIPKFEEVDIYFRVAGTANNAQLGMCVDDAGTTYLRTDTVIGGQRNAGSWSQVDITIPETVITAPPYAVQVKENTCISF